MKLRFIPIAITFVISSSLLFGGWFMYQTYAMEEPFLQHISEIEGVEHSVVEMNRNHANIQVQVTKEASLRDIYQAIMDASSRSLGSRGVTVEFTGEQSNSALDVWWSKALFDVAQAMETKQYGVIPPRLQELAEADGTIQVETEMDHINVYVSIYQGPYSKYVILPRVAAQIGVWPNE